ncbi:MAG TPA: asparagine synthase-related protein [Pyrinomonadaceae bacterium]|nr:asparagine synthase-related protein [Pyrinomonadaceae bacterium]
MSAHGGIFHLDGATVTPDRLSVLSRSLDRRGPDGGGIYSNGALGMAHRAFHTNRASKLESQPLTSRYGHVLTWDGRLDNREELIGKLGDTIEDVRTDAALVLAAYLRWGMDWFAKLIGDWSLALWEPKKKTLLLARDFPGNRPLYYRISKTSVLWSTELETFLDLAVDPPRLNDAYLMRFLAFNPEVGDTPYMDVSPVLPGHVVSIRDGAVEVHKAWEPDLAAEIRYGRDLEYEEHFRDLFWGAVRGRLRAQGVVWAELSGGLDSSSIVCVADEILQGEAVESERVETFSDIYSQSSSTDEREYIGYVEKKRGRRGQHLEESEYQLFLPGETITYFSRPQPNLGRSTKLALLMAQNGARVLLSGQGGDGVMWSMERPCLDLTDMLAAKDLRKLHARIKAYSLHTGRTYWDLFWTDAVNSQAARSTSVSSRRMANDPWINWSLFTKCQREQTVDTLAAMDSSLPASRRISYKLISDAIRILSLHHFRTCGMIDASYPYLDRRLIQFMLSVPFEQKLRPGITRSLHRRAVRGVLPQEILARRGKTGAEECLCRALGREWQAVQSLFGPDARVVRRGYVDLPKLLAAMNEARDGRHPDVYSLMRVISLEVWLRGLELRVAVQPAEDMKADLACEAAFSLES